MLSVGRCLDVHANDGPIRRVDQAAQLVPGSMSAKRGHPRRPGDESIELVQECSDGLVRFYPRGRDARIPQHAMGHRPVARSRVVLERQPGALMRKAIEASVFHRLADLPFDQRLPHALARGLGRVRALRISFTRHDRRVAPDPRQAS